MDGAGSPGSLPAPVADGRGAGIALTCGGGGDNPGGAAGGDGRRRWSQGGGRRARTGELLRAHVTCGSAARPLCRDTLGSPPPCPPSVPASLPLSGSDPTAPPTPARPRGRVRAVSSQWQLGGAGQSAPALRASPRRDQPQGPDVPGSTTAPPPRAGPHRAALPCGRPFAIPSPQRFRQPEARWPPAAVAL